MFNDILPPKRQYNEFYIREKIDYTVSKKEETWRDKFIWKYWCKKNKVQDSTALLEAEENKTSARENWIKFKDKLIQAIRLKRLLSGAEKLRRGRDKHELNFDEEKSRLEWMLLEPDNHRRLAFEYLI